MIGLEKGVVRLVPYTPEWKHLFEVEKASLQDRLGAYILDIQHVGSTSIPDMLAKPIVDIAIAIAEFEDTCVCIPLIEGLGYEYKGEFGIPHRHYFVKGDPRTFHIHMSEIDSMEWQTNLTLSRLFMPASIRGERICRAKDSTCLTISAGSDRVPGWKSSFYPTGLTKRTSRRTFLNEESAGTES